MNAFHPLVPNLRERGAVAGVVQTGKSCGAGFILIEGAEIVRDNHI